MTSVLEQSGNGERFARDKSTSASHTVELQHGFAGSDDGLTFPSLATTYGSNLDGKSGAVGNTFSNAISEAIDLSGGIRIQIAERTSTVEDGEVVVFASQGHIGGAVGRLGTHVLEGDAHRSLIANVDVSGSEAVDRNESAVQSSSRNDVGVRNVLRMGHADGDIATACDGLDRDVGRAALTDHAGAVKDTVLGDTNVRTRIGADGEVVHTDGQGGHVADGVFSGLDAERQNGTVTQSMVGLPVVEGAAVQFIAEGLGSIASQVTDEHHGSDGVVGVVSPHGIVEAHGGLFVGRHGAVMATSSTNTEVVVVEPVGRRAGTDVGIGSLVLGTHHGLTEAGACDAPVGRLAAVTHSEEVLVLVGQVVDIADGEARTSPAGVGTVSGVVGEADTGIQV